MKKDQLDAILKRNEREAVRQYRLWGDRVINVVIFYLVLLVCIYVVGYIVVWYFRRGKKRVQCRRKTGPYNEKFQHLLQP